jgi:hypothetical protein
MATDISKVGNAVQVTVDGGNPRAFVGTPASYSFNAAGTILSLSFGSVNTYEIPLADLRVAGAGSAPASAAAAYTALSAVMGVFP